MWRWRFRWRSRFRAGRRRIASQFGDTLDRKPIAPGEVAGILDIATAIIGLGIIATLVSKRSKAPRVLRKISKAFRSLTQTSKERKPLPS